ncbi:MAG: hypothetical protein JST40_05005 [Armatimonadetes bacterium]|nr:hypothetical protein [Armatimonadota bacterium]
MVESTLQPSRFAVVVSGKSRQGSKGGEIVEDFPTPPLWIEETGSPQEMERAIHRAIEDAVEVLFVGGGDGTIRLAAEQLVGSDIVLAILPLGTGNSLAREIGIPLSIPEAIDFHLNQSVRKSIDVAFANDNMFVTVATIGLTAAIVENLEAKNKKVLGRLAYFPALLSAIRFRTAFTIQIESKAGNFRGRVWQFVAANTRLHGGPFQTTENAAIDDGKVSIYVVKKRGPWDLFKFGLALAGSRHTELDSTWAIDAETATVTLSKARKVILDGDPTYMRQISFRSNLKGLLVSAAPSSISDQQRSP